jgi:hypothetical protein
MKKTLISIGIVTMLFLSMFGFFNIRLVHADTVLYSQTSGSNVAGLSQPWPNSGINYAGQCENITVSWTQVITNVSFDIYKGGTPTNNLTADIRTGIDSGLGSVVASSSTIINASTLSASATYYNFSFSNVQLTLGVGYAFVLRDAGEGGTTSTTLFLCNTNNPDPNSANFGQTNSGWTVYSANLDLILIIYGTNSVPAEGPLVSPCMLQENLNNSLIPLGTGYSQSINSSVWLGNVFSTGSLGHNVSQVSIWIYGAIASTVVLDVGLETTVPSIQSGINVPSGIMLTSGAAYLSIASGPDYWFNVSMNSVYLNASTQYAIVVTTSNSTGSCEWVTNYQYPGQWFTICNSTDGVSWTSLSLFYPQYIGVGFCFEIWDPMSWFTYDVNVTGSVTKQPIVGAQFNITTYNGAFTNWTTTTDVNGNGAITIPSTARYYCWNVTAPGYPSQSGTIWVQCFSVSDGVGGWIDSPGPISIILGPPIALTIGAFWITGMTAGNWVFEGSYYFYHQEYDGALPYILQVKFYDGSTHTVILTYNTTSGVFSCNNNALASVNTVSSFITITNLNLPTQNTTVSWDVCLESGIIDTLGVTYYAEGNTTAGANTNWGALAGSVAYANIYNMGGLLSTSSSGNAGRLGGGGPFDIYCTSAGSGGAGSTVQVTQTWAGLQHIKILQYESRLDTDVHANITYALDYYDPNYGWVSGLSLVLSGWTVNDMTSHIWENVTCSWYQGTTLLNSSVISLFCVSENTTATGTTIQTQFWLDMWFSNANASAVMTGRISAYEWPVTNDANWWTQLKIFLFGGSTYGVEYDLPYQCQASCYLTSTGGMLSRQNIPLVNLRINMTVASGGTYIEKAQLFKQGEMDYTQGTPPVLGIQTPVFDEIKTPLLPTSTGLLGSLFSLFGGMGNVVAGALGTFFGGFVGVLSPLWTALYTFLAGLVNGIFSALGFPGAPAAISTFLGSLWLNLSTAFLDLANIIASGMTFLLSWLSEFMTLIAMAFSSLASMVTNLILFFQGGYAQTTNVWVQLNLGMWLQIGIIFYPLYLCILWEDKGTEGLIKHLQMMWWIISTVFDFLGWIALNFMHIISDIVEAIPVVE